MRGSLDNVTAYATIFPRFKPRRGLLFFFNFFFLICIFLILLTTQERKDSTAKTGIEVKLTINSINGNSSLEVPRAWTVDHLNISERSIPRDGDVDKWPHLSGIELPEIENKEVRVLIGCNVPEAFWVLEERRGGKGEPVAICSLLGWTLIGPTERVDEESSFNVNFVHLEDEGEHSDRALLQQVKNFWKCDFTDSLSSSKVAMSVEDERALRIMEGKCRSKGLVPRCFA